MKIELNVKVYVGGSTGIISYYDNDIVEVSGTWYDNHENARGVPWTLTFKRIELEAITEMAFKDIWDARELGVC